MARPMSVLRELSQWEKDPTFKSGEWDEALEVEAREMMNPTNNVSFHRDRVSAKVGTPASPFRVESVISKVDA